MATFTKKKKKKKIFVCILRQNNGTDNILIDNMLFSLQLA